jgi:hypothetical protein
MADVPSDLQGKVEWIDKHIQPRFPPPGTDTEYGELIRNHQIHNCSTGVNGCLDAAGHCKRGYQDLTVNAETTFTDRGYPVYWRPTAFDLKVVPHNREMLLDWRGHLNVEFCGQTYAVLYLYKVGTASTIAHRYINALTVYCPCLPIKQYLFKGNQKVSLCLNNTADVDPRDEIKLMQRGRMLCAMQAWWFIWGYQNYPASRPSAKLIKVKMPAQVTDLAVIGKVCDMALYFARPRVDEMQYLTYTQFFSKFDYALEPPNYATVDGAHNYQVVLHKKTYHVYQTAAKHIVRMGMVPIGAGEIFWLRVLLYWLPAYSYQEIKTVGDVVCKSFQEAAHLRRFTHDQQTATEIYLEAVVDCTPHQLRVLFTNLTLQGFPTLHIYNNPDLCYKMYQDYQDRHNSNRNLAVNEMLLQLSQLFKHATVKRLSEFGLPEPEAQDTELQIERLTYTVDAQLQLAAELVVANPLTDEMQILFDDLVAAVRKHGTEEQPPFTAILQGVAGSGKTTFVKYLMATVRAMGYVAKGCASTGLAASVYDDFTTAHALFAIPVIDDDEDFDQEGDLQCRLDQPKYEERRELLNAMRVCAWDEISSQHMRDVRATMAAMNGFRGKVLLLVGDGLQITPVVPYGSKAAICASSLYCSELMHSARFYQFTKILRLQNSNADPTQANYARLLRGVSTNSEDLAPEGDTEPSLYIACDARRPEGIMRICIPHLRHFFSPADAVLFCHPGGFDTNIMHTSCILAATNAQVDYWNREVQLLNNAHELWTLLSKDSFSECDDPHGYLAAMVTEDVMNKCDDPGAAPPHELHLKVHDICILMRAVSKADKLATNTRVRVTGISNHLVRVTTLDALHPRSASLPRFVFKLKVTYGKAFYLTRRQFPLRLAYALTMNRSQGQTLDRVVVDLTRHCFMQVI